MTPAERWLRDWHARHPGATSRSFAHGKPSSYEHLARFAAEGDRVLDLACGDGMLLELLLGRGVSRAVGLDMSAEELASARARLGSRAAPSGASESGPSVELFEGMASALPFPEASFDLVTCHMAFMLMESVDEVVSEIVRVLRPGGRFAAVVGSLLVTETTWSEVIPVFAQAGLSGPQIGDKRTHDEEGLREVFRPFEDVRVERFTVDVSGTEDEVWNIVAETYLPEMTPPGSLDEIEKACREIFRKLRRPDGRVPCPLPVICTAGTAPQRRAG